MMATLIGAMQLETVGSLLLPVPRDGAAGLPDLGTNFLLMNFCKIHGYTFMYFLKRQGK